MEREQEELAIVKECAEGGTENAWRSFVEIFDRQIRGNIVQTLLRLDLRAYRDTVDELVQEVYCRLLDKNRRALRHCRAQSDSSFRGYLACLCTNLVVDHLRSRSAQKRGGWQSSWGSYADPRRDSVAERLESVADHAAGPEARFLMAESRRFFLRSCGSLLDGKSPQRDLEIVRLAFVEGWTSREISERLEGRLKPGSIDSMIHRQRRRLRAKGLTMPSR